MMRTGTQWFRGTLTLAFLAIVALFVSPALAYSCCCMQDAPVAPQALRVSAPTPACHKQSNSAVESKAHCAEKARTSTVTHTPSTSGLVMNVADDCSCDQPESLPFTSQVTTSFSSVPLALTSQPLLLLPLESVHTAHWVDEATYFRSRHWKARFNRGPPALAIS